MRHTAVIRVTPQAKPACNTKHHNNAKSEPFSTVTMEYLPSAIVHANVGAVELHSLHICQDCALGRSVGGGGSAGLHTPAQAAQNAQHVTTHGANAVTYYSSKHIRGRLRRASMNASYPTFQTGAHTGESPAESYRFDTRASCDIQPFVDCLLYTSPSPRDRG